MSSSGRREATVTTSGPILRGRKIDVLAGHWYGASSPEKSLASERMESRSVRRGVAWVTTEDRVDCSWVDDVLPTGRSVTSRAQLGSVR